MHITTRPTVYISGLLRSYFTVETFSIYEIDITFGTIADITFGYTALFERKDAIPLGNIFEATVNRSPKQKLNYSTCHQVLFLYFTIVQCEFH